MRNRRSGLVDNAASSPASAREPADTTGTTGAANGDTVLSHRRRSVGRFTRLLGESLRLAWIADRRTFIITVILQLVGGLIAAVQVLVVKRVLDAIVAVQDTKASVTGAIPSVTALAIVTAIASVSAAVLTQQQRLLSEQVTFATWRRLLDVAGAVGLRSFESSGFYDRLNRVQTNATSRPYLLMLGLIGLVGGVAGSVGLAGAIVSLEPLLLPLLLLSGVPLWLTGRAQSRREFAFVVKQTPVIRFRTYLSRVLTDRDAAKELRAFQFGDALRHRYDTTYNGFIADLRSHIGRRSTLAFFGALLSAVVLGATLFVLIWLVGRHQVTLAQAGAALVAIRLMSSQVTTVFASVQQIFESGLFLDDYHEFLELQPAAEIEQSGDTAPNRFERIQVEGLQFTYPGSDQLALDAISLHIKAGEVVALVGENGSGKTTLAKILAGLYSPDAGVVRWDGVDVMTYDQAGLRRAIAVIFQDFARYELTARENIAAGLPQAPDDPERVTAAARQAGADIFLESLPYKYETILSKQFKDGRDLSLGQWQRVALARAFYRDAPLVILDEPSASLDPRAEYELFSHIRDLLLHRTVLFISHRFSTVRSADRIYVMDKGHIVAGGTHDELMAEGGLYADLFRLQAAAYLDPTKTD